MEPILTVQKVSHTYGKGTPFAHKALDDVTFSVYPGEFLGVIGRTGSGKSTLIQHLNGLLAPDEGQVLWQGEDVWQEKGRVRALRFQVGLVFQYPEYQLFEETVGKDIAFGPRNMGLPPEEISRRVTRAMDFVGLPQELLEQSPFALSGGQKRRVAIAGVIAMEPKVLVLDEPTAGLDPAGSDEILQNLQRYHRENGGAVVLVSHSMETVARLASRLVVLADSRVALMGTPQEVFSHGETLEKLGLGVPQMTKLFSRLTELGLTVPRAVYTLDEAEEALRRLLAEKGGR